MSKLPNDDAFIFYTMKIWSAIQLYTKEFSYTSHSVFQHCSVGSRTELTEAQIQFLTTETNYSLCIQKGNDYTLYDRSIFVQKIFVYALNHDTFHYKQIFLFSSSVILSLVVFTH